MLLCSPILLFPPFLCQNNLVQLLEMVLSDASEKLPYALEVLSVDGILECLVTVVGSSAGIKMDKHITRNQQGAHFYILLNLQ